jgi:hypothetical protein
MPTPPLPTAADVRMFVYDWYRKLDQHVPVDQYLPSLSDNMVMVLPEAKLEGVDAFAAWYRGGSSKFNLPGVIGLFFDERHELKMLDVTVAGNSPSEWRADVLLVVKWEARRWKPPQPKSEYLGFDAWQRWTCKLAPAGQPVICQYIVDKLEKLQGSADL